MPYRQVKVLGKYCVKWTFWGLWEWLSGQLIIVRACPKGKSKNWFSLYPGTTLNEISVQSVMPCVIIGSWSSVLPSQQSSSIQRQPASNACLYISTEDFPVNWWPYQRYHNIFSDTNTVIKWNVYIILVGGVVASWLGHLSPDWAVQVSALAGDMLLHVLGKDTLPSQCLSHPGV